MYLNFRFDWNAKNPIPQDENQSVKFSAIASGTAHAVFFWWDLDMDVDGDIVLSCAPPWAHPDGIERNIFFNDVFHI